MIDPISFLVLVRIPYSQFTLDTWEPNPVNLKSIQITLKLTRKKNLYTNKIRLCVVMSL